MLSVLLETYLHLHSAVKRIEVAPDHVRRHSKIGLFRELDDRNRVRRRNVGMERLVVDRVGKDRPASAHRSRLQHTSARETRFACRVHPSRASVAVQDHEPPVRSARPERATGLGEIREDTRRFRIHGLGHANYDSYGPRQPAHAFGPRR